MKKVFLLLIFIIFEVSANTGPAEILSLDSSPKSKDDSLTQNVSVEREDLIFDFSSDVNAYKPNIKETFDAKKVFEKWRSKFKVQDYGEYATYSFTSQKSYFHFSFGQLDKKNVWYADWSWVSYISDEYDDNIMKITAKYYLKNNSDKEINNKTAYFSPFSDASISNIFPLSYWKQTNAYYLLLNNLTWNVFISFSGEKLYIKSKYKTSIKNFWKNMIFKQITIKPIYEFNISLKPNEQKILQIEYYIPKWYYKYYNEGQEWRYSYDFAPVFEWKWNNLPLLNLKYIYDKWNRFSYCSSDKLVPYTEGSDAFVFSHSKFFDKLVLASDDKKNIYQAEYANLKKWDIRQLNFIDYKDTENIYNYEMGRNKQATCFENWITWVEVVDENKVRVCFNSEETKFDRTCENPKIMSKDEFYKKHDKEL